MTVRGKLAIRTSDRSQPLVNATTKLPKKVAANCRHFPT